MVRDLHKMVRCASYLVAGDLREATGNAILQLIQRLEDSDPNARWAVVIGMTELAKNGL
jgi:hypothetical protein